MAALLVFQERGSCTKEGRWGGLLALDLFGQDNREPMLPVVTAIRTTWKASRRMHMLLIPLPIGKLNFSLCFLR